MDKAPMQRPLKAPLSDRDLKRLEQFLEETCVPEGGLSLESLDGLLCALAIGPELVMPSTWIPMVMGEANFKDESQANTIIDLLMRRWNLTVGSVKVNPLSGGSGAYVPLIDPQDRFYEDDALDSLCGYDWADGFILGMTLSQSEWDSLFDEESLSDCLTPIMLLNTGTIRAVVDEEITHARRKQMVEMIPRSVHLLWAYWQSNPTPSGSAPVGSASKVRVGRNDPCPCGSGKKYKKCCLH
jgi:uncharacterized protein